MSATTNKAYTGDAPEAVFYIVSAVQFSIAWGILMWLSETCLTITLYLRTRGVLYPNVQEIIDQKPMYYLYYDVLNLFMLSVAGFNMGAAASLPPKVIKLLVQTDFTESKNSAIFNCSDTTIYDNVNSTMVTCPSQFKDIDSGVGQNVENISIYNLRAGVVMMLFLIWTVIISIVQDCIWILYGKPAEKSNNTPSKGNENETNENETKEKDSDSGSNDDDAVNADGGSKPVETEVVADADGDGDSV